MHLRRYTACSGHSQIINYLGMIARARLEAGCDAIFTSDDLGTQTRPFFSLEIFREFYKPYYRELIEKAHSLGMHFWMHACGNVLPFIQEWLDIGLDVLHPIQKHTRDEREIAAKYGRILTMPRYLCIISRIRLQGQEGYIRL